VCIPGHVFVCLPQGKVRDTYELDDKLVIVTTDRQSAFDRLLASIPFKGQVRRLGFDLRVQMTGFCCIICIQLSCQKLIRFGASTIGVAPNQLYGDRWRLCVRWKAMPAGVLLAVTVKMQ
jgi:hypothetical protein